MIIVYALNTDTALTQNEVETIVERDGIWKGKSVEYRMCCYNFYQIEKKEANRYETSVSRHGPDTWEVKGSYSSFKKAFEYLHKLENSLVSLAVSPKEELGNILFDKESKTEITAERIRTIVGRDNIWEGYSDEWEPGLHCYYRIIRIEVDGYTVSFNVFAKAGGTNLSAIGLPTMPHVFETLFTYHDILRRGAKKFS